MKGVPIMLGMDATLTIRPGKEQESAAVAKALIATVIEPTTIVVLR